MNTALLIPILLGSLGQAPKADDPPPGRRFALADEASLFVPDGYRPRDGATVDVVLLLHGAPSVVEKAFVDSGWPAVLVVFNRKGLSSAYARPFADRELFPRLLENARRAVEAAKIAGSPKLGKVAVSSFSAGFGGVRELLKVPEHFDRIDILILADSLYCGYEGDPKSKRVDPALMAGFRAFAKDAAAGKKRLVASHSAQVPEGYASTTETADDLIRAVGGEATPGRVDRGDGWVETRSFREKGMTIVGVDGAGPEDHMRHLRQVARLWKMAREG